METSEILDIYIDVINSDGPDSSEAKSILDANKRLLPSFRLIYQVKKMGERDKLNQ